MMTEPIESLPPTIQDVPFPSSRVVIVDWDGTLAFSCPAAACARKRLTSPFPPVEMDRNGQPEPTALFLRPGTRDFLEELSAHYIVGLWSFGVAEYVAQSLQNTGLADAFALVRTRADMTLPVKDLYTLTGDLTRVLIVDDEPTTFGFLNPDNCIPIPPWSPFREDAAAGEADLRRVLYAIPVWFQLLENFGPRLHSLREQRLALLLQREHGP